MNFSLTKASKEPLSDQICLSVMERIRSGLLQEGEALPSVRALSAQINVSVLTVLRAYKKLEEMGYVVRKQGKGTFVSSRQSKEGRNDPPLFDWQSSIHDYIGRSWFAQYTKRPKSEMDYPFHMAALSQEEFLPVSHVQKAIQMASKDVSAMSDHVSPAGDRDLRTALADYLQETGCRLSVHELMITTGCQQGLDLVARTFVGPGDIVAVESPTYPAALDVFRSRGATIVPIPSDHSGVRIDLLTALFDQRPPKVIYLIPTGQNPTGRVMDIRTRQAILDLAESFHCLIIEDDPWGELYYGESPPPTIFSMDTSGHVLYLKGFSKTLVPGLRIGVLAARGSVLQRIVNVKAFADLCTPLFNQRCLLYLLQNYSLGRHFERLREELKERRDRVHRLLQTCAPPQLKWDLPQAGPNFWLHTPHNTDLLLIEAEKEGISFLPGSVCFHGAAQQNCLRLGFASLPWKQTERGIKALCRLVEEFDEAHLDHELHV